MGATFTILPDESMYTPENFGHLIPSEVIAPTNCLQLGLQQVIERRY